MSDVALPEYRRIRESLRAQLEAGELQPGEQIPTERELVDRFGVAHMTVRHAVEGLVREGLLVRRRGLGTFVVHNRAVSRSINRLQSFTADVGDLTAGALVIRNQETKPDEEIAEMLELFGRGKVIELLRVRTIEGKPVAINQVWIPVRVAPLLVNEDMQDRSLHEYLEGLGVQLARAEQLMFAVAADAWQAEQLQVKEGTPLLASERLSRDAANTPIEYARTWTLPDLPVRVEMSR